MIKRLFELIFWLTPTLIIQSIFEVPFIDMRKKVLSVKPGITDMASIRMSNESDILKEYEDVYQAYIDVILPIKQKYYCEYVDNNSLWLDVKIIFLTFKKILLH